MKLKVVRIALWRTELQTRLPFRYGIATMTQVPHLFVELELLIDGVRCGGRSADHLPPRWFTKDPSQTIAEEIDAMIAVIRHAAAAAVQAAEVSSVFDFWLELYLRQDEWRKGEGIPPLLAHFGTSLIERAVIDAFCRHTGIPLARAVRDNLLGLRLGELYPELGSTQPAHFLPTTPLRRVALRHTVGLGDSLEATDLASPLDDGLPETLEAAFASYGLQQIKIKFTSSTEVPRLGNVLELMARRAGPTAKFTLDGNESFLSVDAFQAAWDAIEAPPVWRRVRQGLICVEQPFHRDFALSEKVGRDLRAWTGQPPMIIDESDGEVESIPRAVAVGYVGADHKNCKGVNRGIAAACWFRQRIERGLPALQTGEDLVNVGPVALLQDLTVQALLGIESVERNGHHYFRGLSFLPQDCQQAVAQARPDLYESHPRGFVALKVREGWMRIDSLPAAPFGVGFNFSPASFATLAGEFA